MSVSRELAAVAILLLLGASCAAGALIVLSSIAETGPNCPGADPSWIGWCSEAPRN